MQSLHSPSEIDEDQRLIIKEMKERKTVLLALPMSYGKTVTTATAVLALMDEWQVTQVLIVAPLRVAESTWPEEFEAWEHLKDIKFSVLTGTEEARIRAAKRRVPIHIINRENVPWLYKFWGDKWPYDCLIYDEASRLKGGRKRTRPSKKPRKDGTMPTRNLSEFGALAKVRQLMPYKALLTGTPSPNGLVDLWGQIYQLDGGERLGTSKNAFLQRWFTSDFNGFRYEPRDGAFNEIMSRIRDVMISMPDNKVKVGREYNPIYVNLPAKVLREYKAFEKTLIAERWNVEAKNRGVLANKLLQFANGSLYDDDGKDHPVHSVKLDALESIVEEAAGAPVLVAYNFQFDKAAIKKRFKNAEFIGKDQSVIKRWNAGKVPLLCAHPASAGHGLNLQFGGNIACWYGLTWDLELYEQFNKRLHRRGQANDVVLHHILARGTIDERVYSVLPGKASVQDKVLRAVLLKAEDRAAAEGMALDDLAKKVIENSTRQKMVFDAIAEEIKAMF